MNVMKDVVVVISDVSVTEEGVLYPFTVVVRLDYVGDPAVFIKSLTEIPGVMHHEMLVAKK